LIEKVHSDSSDSSGGASGYGSLYIPVTLTGGRFEKNTFTDCIITGLSAGASAGTNAASAGLTGKPLKPLKPL